jgi:hypothetical protein
MKDRLFARIMDEIANSNGRIRWASSPGAGRDQAAPADHSRKKASPRPSAARSREWRTQATRMQISDQTRTMAGNRGGSDVGGPSVAETSR